jgi:hypothetical protein
MLVKGGSQEVEEFRNSDLNSQKDQLVDFELNRPENFHVLPTANLIWAVSRIQRRCHNTKPARAIIIIDMADYSSLT